MNTNTLIEGRDLRKTYRLGGRADVAALRGVDMSIGQGEMVAIMGPSGSGKSTLMHILGLLHAPDLNNGPRPSLRFEGRDMVKLGESERTRIRARRMGFVFQSFNLVPTLTALENVMLSYRPAELSGGEQQRIATARALVNRPSLILADEPTGNLDSERSAEVLSLLRWFNRQHGQTIVLVTHDPEVGAACDRVVRMRDGHVQEQAAVLVRPMVSAMPQPVISAA